MTLALVDPHTVYLWDCFPLLLCPTADLTQVLNTVLRWAVARKTNTCAIILFIKKSVRQTERQNYWHLLKIIKLNQLTYNLCAAAATDPYLSWELDARDSWESWIRSSSAGSVFSVFTGFFLSDFFLVAFPTIPTGGFVFFWASFFKVLFSLTAYVKQRRNIDKTNSENVNKWNREKR